MSWAWPKASLEASTRYPGLRFGSKKKSGSTASAPVRSTPWRRGAFQAFTEMLKHYEAHAPLKRNVLPDELGATGTFLASEGSAAIHRPGYLRRLRLRDHGDVAAMNDQFASSAQRFTMVLPKRRRTATLVWGEIGFLFRDLPECLHSDEGVALLGEVARIND